MSEMPVQYIEGIALLAWLTIGSRPIRYLL